MEEKEEGEGGEMHGWWVRCGWREREMVRIVLGACL